MGGYLWLLLLFLGFVAGTAFIYSQRQFTFPGYEGKGHIGVPIFWGLIGITAGWVVGLLAGAGNVYAHATNILSFSVKYDDALLNAGAWTFIAGLVVLLAVEIWAQFRYGPARM